MSRPKKSLSPGFKLFIAFCIIGTFAVSGFVVFGDQPGLRPAAPMDGDDVPSTARDAPTPRAGDNLGKKRSGG